MRSLFVPPRRTVEASPAQIVAVGASGGYGADPVDGDYGWRRAGSAGREVPPWTQEKARQFSVAAYRMNPMARAIIDTYTAFAVGDSGVHFQATNAEVRMVVEEFWTDPRNNLGGIQELLLRDQLIMGETLLELMQGARSGVVRFSPVDTTGVTDVTLVAGNPLWPDQVILGQAVGTERRLQVAAVDDSTGVRDGEAMWWTPFKTLVTDKRGMPFMSPILDWLDSYDTVLSNLIDRTALARYMVWDVTVHGGQEDVDNFVRGRGGLHVPQAGTVEVHNESVAWEAKTAQTGSYEDTNAARNVLTLVSAGAGLAKAQPLDCKVLTPSGWRRMGDLRVGDEVLTPKGTPSLIVGVYPQGCVETFRLTFSDGASTRSCGDHLWLTQTHLDRRYKRPGSVKTTRDIAASLRRGSSHWNHYVPLVEPIDGPDGDLSIDPYILGVLLGDGHMRIKTDGAVEILLSSADTDLVAEVNRLLSEGEFGHINRYDYRYRCAAKDAALRSAVRELGLCGAKSHTKFIPSAYLEASAKSRLSLLQGLLDTDGSPSFGTSVHFVTVSPQLADEVRELVWSLGGVCTLATMKTSYTYRGAKRAGRTAYRLRITLPEGERYFRLDRKQSLIRSAGQKTGRAVRTVREVEPIGMVECQCIAIDDPEHLYVTDNYIVTHNTWLAEPEDANRATSLTMAEPVRRRVQGVQKLWLGYQTELVRFAVDRAVAAKRLSATVEATDPKTGQSYEIPAAQSVIVTGPEVAAADAQITAQVLLNLSTGLEKLVAVGALSGEAARVAARKAWEDYVGVPYTADLDGPDANPDDVATAVDDARGAPSARLAVVNGSST